MTLNPEATSMLSLFCVWVCVVAQPNINAAHPAAILLRKIRLVGFITLSLVVDYWLSSSLPYLRLNGYRNLGQCERPATCVPIAGSKPPTAQTEFTTAS